MTIRKWIEDGFLPAFAATVDGGDGGGGGAAEKPSDNGDDLSADDLAAIEEMQRVTPDQAGEPSVQEGEPEPQPSQKAEGEGGNEPDAELEEGEEELTIGKEGQPRDADGKFVSKSALLRVKEQNKATRAELAVEREAKAKLEGRLNILTEIINGVDPAAQKPGEKKSDASASPWDEADVDPAEDFVKAMDQLKRRSSYERQQRESMVSTQTARDQEVAVVQTYVNDAQRIARDQIEKGEVVEVNGRQLPVYAAAYAHLVSLRHAQLAAIGVTDKAQRERVIVEEERNLVHEALSRKMSPAQAIFDLAMASGFQKPSGAAKPNGKAAAAEKLEQVSKGMQATKSLSGAGGAAYAGVDAKSIANMDDDQFAAFVGKLSERELEKLLGG